MQATREDKARKEAERVALEADKRKAAAVSNDENTSGDENTDGGGVGGSARLATRLRITKYSKESKKVKAILYHLASLI